MNSYNINKMRKANEFWETKRAELERLYYFELLSQHDIAKRIGLSQQKVCAGFKRLGIKSRPRWNFGNKNGRFIDGSESRAYRKMIAITKCEKCASESDLLVHHKNDDHHDNTLSNLQVLCRPCHFSHHKTEWWKKRKAEMKAQAGAN